MRRGATTSKEAGCCQDECSGADRADAPDVRSRSKKCDERGIRGGPVNTGTTADDQRVDALQIDGEWSRQKFEASRGPNGPAVDGADLPYVRRAGSGRFACNFKSLKGPRKIEQERVLEQNEEDSSGWAGGGHVGLGRNCVSIDISAKPGGCQHRPIEERGSIDRRGDKCPTSPFKSGSSTSRA